MWLPLVAGLLLSPVLAGSAAADAYRGTWDSAPYGRPLADPGRPLARSPYSGSERGGTVLERIDPAVRQYWSDKCVRERAAGRQQPRDCYHPAYSGTDRMDRPRDRRFRAPQDDWKPGYWRRDSGWPNDARRSAPDRSYRPLTEHRPTIDRHGGSLIPLPPDRPR